MRKVLIIAYYFPPMAGAGVQKSQKIVKYLHEFGYESIVLSVNPVYTRNLKDYSQLSDIPDKTVVYRTPTFDWNWLFKLLWGCKLNIVVKWLQHIILLPDPEISWLHFARYALRKICRKYNIDLVYISGSPFSSFSLGPYIKRRFHIPFVVDFRDEWTNNPTRLDKNYPKSSLKIELRLEESILRECSAVIYTIPSQMKMNFEQKYPFLSQKLTSDISNGFDESDFIHVNAITESKNPKLSILYAGTFYDRRQPGLLWKALHRLIKEQSINPVNIEFEIIGKNKPAFVLGEYFQDDTLSGAVSFLPNLNHTDLLHKLYQADLLLLYIAPGPNSQAELTGKIFEYMRTYKPILAVIPPDGIAADILRKSGSAYICDSAEEDSIYQCLLQVYTLWHKNQLVINPDQEYISTFNRKALTAKLAQLFDEVLKNNLG